MHARVRSDRGCACLAERRIPNIVSFTSYLVHSQDIPKFAAYRAREFPRLFPGGAFPPNTLLVVDRLVREDLLVEVAAVAAL